MSLSTERMERHGSESAPASGSLFPLGDKLSFLNLCNQQTSIYNVEAKDLPAKLPAGFSFVMGVNVSVFTGGQLIKDLTKRVSLS